MFFLMFIDVDELEELSKPKGTCWCFQCFPVFVVKWSGSGLGLNINTDTHTHYSDSLFFLHCLCGLPRLIWRSWLSKFHPRLPLMTNTPYHVIHFIPTNLFSVIPSFLRLQNQADSRRSSQSVPSHTLGASDCLILKYYSLLFSLSLQLRRNLCSRCSGGLHCVISPLCPPLCYFG